jgi:16S rRNA (guanine(966)-N(2))-methyltransferase RsmD
MKTQKKSVSQQCRIIAGTWKRTPLTVLDLPGLRPTPDRVRETLFNWLNFLFQGDWRTRHCLDLFAGSGALGFEAASRGAQQVTLVETHPSAFQQLEKSRAKLNAEQIRLIAGDALSVVKKLAVSDEKYDVIFLDPPFHRDLLAQVVPDCMNLLKADGLLYLEAEQALTLADLPDCLKTWRIVRQDRAGKVFFHLLTFSPLPLAGG